MATDEPPKNERAAHAPAGAAARPGTGGSAHNAWIVPAWLQTADGRRIDCTLLDVSPRGARLVAWEPLAKGEVVTLCSVALGDARARVMWVGADTAALEFLDNTSQVAQPRALVVEDDEALRELWRRGLERAGFVVADAMDGRAALKLFRERQVDLAVTDLNMPEMDGLTFIRELTSLQPSAHIIVVTGAASGHDQARALGAKAVLRKPVSLADLVRTVQQVLAGKP